MCCLEVSKRRHLCVVVGAPAQLPRLVEDLESLCWRTSDLDPEGWSTGSTGNGINRSENPSLPLAPQIFPSGDTQSSQSSRDQTPSWMQVWPGLWEYLRLALPCVAMLAVEWWSFDPQINIYRMIQFQRSHVFLWHFGCSGTGGTYGRLFPFTRNLSAEAMGFGDFQLWNLSLFLRRWPVGVMGLTNLLRMSLRPMSLRCCMCADLVRRRLHLHWLEAETETKRNHGKYCI